MKKLLATLALLVSLSLASSGEDIWFSWTKNPSSELIGSYRMEYQKLPAVTNWTLLTTLPATTNVAVVKNIQGGFIYKFRIFAVNGVGVGTNLSTILQIPTNAPSATLDFETISPR
jgi:hypothetical protein